MSNLHSAQFTVPNPSSPYHLQEDENYLLSISPSTIFLHDGVLRSLNLKSLKEFEESARFQDVLSIPSTEQMEELMTIGLNAISTNRNPSNSTSGSNNTGKNNLSGSDPVADLPRKILKLSTWHVQAIGLHHRYQWHVLERMWRHKHAQALQEKGSNSEALNPAYINQDVTQEAPERPLGFKLSLCLLVPMMEMYANQNSSVALSSLRLLFDELSSVPIMSLRHESSCSLEKLEDLLVQWASNSDSGFAISGPAAMITLACARGTISSFGKTILMLENLESPMRSLPVAQILRKLNDSRSKIGKPCALSGDDHLIMWPYDDRLLSDSKQLNRPLGTVTHSLINSALNDVGSSQETPETVATPANRLQLVPANPGYTFAAVVRQAITNNTASQNNSTSPNDEFHRRFIASDGSYLFVTGSDGKGLAKMGSGVKGTLQGWIYHNNIDLNCGFLIYSEGLLISRPFGLDKVIHGKDDQVVFGVTINSSTLKPDKLILIEAPADELEEIQKKTNSTLGMTSDGSLIYVVRAELPTGEIPISQVAPIPIYLDVWKLVHDPAWPHYLVTPKSLKNLLTHRSDDTVGAAPPERPATATPVTAGGVVQVSINEDRAVRRTRSVRITPPPPPPPPPPFFNTGGSPDSLNTTLNVALKQLQMGMYLTCGNFLTILVSTNAHFFLQNTSNSNSPPILGPTSAISSASYRQFSPVMSSSVSRSIGNQFHFNLLNTGNILGTKHDLTNVSPDSSFFHGGIIPETGAVYDSLNNLIWTCNGALVDCWRNSGHIPHWKQNELLLLGNTLNQDISVNKKDSQNCDVKTVVNVMTKHIGIMANNFVHGDSDANIGFGEVMSGQVIKTLIDLVLKYRENFLGPELTAIFLAMRAIVSQIKGPLEPESTLHDNLYSVQVLILCLLNDPNISEKFDDQTAVYNEGCKLFSSAFDLLYTTTKSRNEFFKELYEFVTDEQEETSFDEAQEGTSSQFGQVESEIKYFACGVSRNTKPLKLLEECVLTKFSEHLNDPSLSQYEDGMKWIVGTPWLTKIIKRSVEDIRSAYSTVADKGYSFKELLRIAANYPLASVPTLYIEAVVNFFLRCLMIHGTSSSNSSSSSNQKPSSSADHQIRQRSLTDVAIETFREILKAGPSTVEIFTEHLSTFEGPLSLAMYNCTEALVKSSVLAHGIPQILSLLSLESLSLNMRHVLDELTEECIHLTVAMSFLATKLNSGGNSTSPNSGDHVGDDWSSRVRTPSPWNTKRIFESPHPVRENFKGKETIVIPNARQLYLKLSPQSATQYDYDRLTFYPNSGAQATPTGITTPQVSPKKIVDFGGNYYGYGNRFFSGPGWARGLIKLADSNSVSYSFEMKSGREHSVPDKALWGYQFALFPILDYSDLQKPSRGQDDTESMIPVNTGFSTITALHCIDVIQNLARMLLEGTAPTPEEKNNAVILENRLTASLKWSTKLSIGKDPVPRKFSQDIITKLKRAVGVSPLQMRLSIIEKMKASELEEVYLQCCMQHIGPNPYLNTDTILSPACESCWTMDPTRDLLREIFHNIDSLFRKIMAFYEMEKMLTQEIEEISAQTKEISEAFFSDSSFLENPQDLQTLAWICYLDYDKDNPANLINDVTQMVSALSADGTAPTLTRTDELIEETHQKCKYLLAASPSAAAHSIFFGPVYPTQKFIQERLHNIHQFISAHMQNPSATIGTFMEAMRSRRERAGDRIKGLDILHKVLECSSPTSSLLIVSSILLQSGPRLNSILCSGLEQEVIKIFGEVLKTAVGIAEKNPLLHRYSIALLSITQYDRTDEENLVESGLVGLLDQLCAYQTGHLTPLYQSGSPTETLSSTRNISPELAVVHNKASTLAWAAFQVLAGQCASWERPSSLASNSKGKSSDHHHVHHHHLHHQNIPSVEDPSEWDEPEHRELPLQISINITNHLARAAALAALSSSNGHPSFLEDQHKAQTCSTSLSVAIQDVLDLLNNLRTYKIGRAILKQSPCICRLLGLLQDSRLSPRLVLTILKLLHTALPLVDDLDTANFKQIVPMKSTSKGGGGGPPISSFWTVIESTPYTQVSSMLLSKLADYLVCGSTSGGNPSDLNKADSQKVQCSTGAGSNSSTPGSPAALLGTPLTQGLIDPAYDHMEVWLHKGTTNTVDHQNPTSSFIRQLFVDAARQDLRPSRGTLNDLENELNANGKVLLYSEESSVAERKALRISQLGHLVTLLPSGWSKTPAVYRRVTTTIASSSTKGSSDLLCKDRNNHLATWDPARPFLSGHVAENLASEIVQLVRELLSTSRKDSMNYVLSGCSSKGNVQSGSSTTSVASTIGAASICTGGDTDSLVSEASAQLRVQPQKPSQWPGAMEQVICAALKLLPRLLSIQNPTNAHIESYVYSARLIIAALTVLGGFTETIRAGLEVWIVEEENKRESAALSTSGDDGEDLDTWEFKATRARVISVSDTSPTAKVEILPTPPPPHPVSTGQKHGTKLEETKGLGISDILTVPLCRLVPGHYTRCGMSNLPNLSRMAQIDLAGFLKTLLITTTTSNSGSGKDKENKEASSKEFPLKRQLPTLNQIVSSANYGASAESRQIAQSMTIVRLLAEIRSKSMQVLSLWLRRKEFSSIFLGIGSESQFGTKRFSNEVLEATENLKELSKLCIPSHKTSSLETQVAWMRLLYRDCTKPPRVPLNQTDKLLSGEDTMRWDLSRQFPKIRSTVFSSISNSLVYTGDYNVSGGNPRGLVLYGNGSIPTNGFYWEATIVTMEDLGQHADLIVIPPLSIGFSPLLLNSSGGNTNDVWKYSSGTVMYTTLGRAVHYKTQDPGSWVTLRLDDDMLRIKAGDTIGIGWEKQTVPSLVANPGSTVQRTPYGRGRGYRGQIRNQSLSLVPHTGEQDNALPPLPLGRGIGRGRGHLNRGSNMLTLDSQVNSLGQGWRGVIYFTLNGRRLPSTVEQVNNNLYPIIHVQKRQMIVQTNLGERQFVYPEANKIHKTQKPNDPSQPGTGPQVDNRANPNQDAGTSNADVLLRRVSDSLQDLNLVFNINLNEFDSDPEINFPERSGSNDTLSGVSNNSTAGSRSRRGDHEILEEEEEEDLWDNHLDADDDDDDEDPRDHEEDDEDSDNREMASSEPNIPRDNLGFRLLPPSPVSGVSASGSSIIAVRRPNFPQRPHSARPLSGGSRKSPGTSKKSPGGTHSLSSLDPSGSTSRKNEVVAKPLVTVPEYNPIKSLEYFMGHSPTAGIKVYQGPNRYVCPCVNHAPNPLDFLLLENNGKSQTNQDLERRADIESLDSYEDDEDDDIHSLLVKAWEQQVFPVIRRRFRNESERRDGLEQIRGALQLGMIEIARQTVEFLYEEGGGLPRDLHFPTLDEIRADAAKCTMEKIKTGMNVIIRSLQQDQVIKDTGLMPNYAVTGMLRTFGLVGEVLEVDLQHDLVLVETYIESEGVLVRYWYPVNSLDKAQMSKKPTLSANTVNMFKLHSNLITMEGSLCHLYSRMCYLSIAEKCMTPSSPEDHDENDLVSKKKAQVSSQIFQHFDLDSVQILSDSLLANFPPCRDLFTSNLHTESPSLKFLLDCGNPSVLFYKQHYDRVLSKHLRSKLRESSNSTKSGEDSVEELTNALLKFLETPEKFLHYDLPLDRIHDVEVYLPGVAFSLVSFKGTQNPKQMSSLDNAVHPCVHVSSYDSGEISRHLQACYPLELLHVIMHRASSVNNDGTNSIISHTAPTSAGASNSSAAAAMNKTMRKRHGRFPPIMCPTERMFCSISELSLMDVTAEIQGIPKEFPLALLYLQILVEEFHLKENPNLSFTHVTNAVTKLLDFIDHFPLSPVIKDWIFTIIAELTRVRSQDDQSWSPVSSEKIRKSCTPNRLFFELLLLRDKETLEPGQQNHVSPIVSALSDHLDAISSKGKPFAGGALMFHISNFILAHQKSSKSPTDPNYSYYFNTLNDLCLALNEKSELMANPYEIIPCVPPSLEASPSGTPPRRPSPTESTTSTSPGNSGPSTPVTGNKRVLAKAVRKRPVQITLKETMNYNKDKKGSNGPSGSNGGGPSDKSNGGNKGMLTSSPSDDGLLTVAKASEVEWFNNQVIITRALKDIVWHSPNDYNCVEAAQVLIGTVLDKLKTSTVFSRLLVIQGAPVNIDGMSIEASMIRALRGCGGIHGNEMWISGNSAVVEIRSLAKVNEAYDTLKQNKVWYPLEDYVLYPNVTVYKVSENLKVSTPSSPAPSNAPASTLPRTSAESTESEGDQILQRFLKHKITDSEAPNKLSFKATEVLTEIFMSCYGVTIPFTTPEEEGEEEEMSSQQQQQGSTNDQRVILLGEEQIMLRLPGNLMEMFSSGLLKSMEAPEAYLKGVLSKYGEKLKKTKKKEKEPNPKGESETKEEKPDLPEEEDVGLSLRGYLSWCSDLLMNKINLLWKGILAAGYDLRLDQVWVNQDPPTIYNYYHTPEKWSLEKDTALISYLDQFAQTLHIDPTRIQPPELYLTESDYLKFQTLQGVDIAHLRVRWGMFQKMNTLVSKKLLAQVSFHAVRSTHKSLGRLLHDSRQLLLYYVKDMYLYKIVQVSAMRGGDTATPEITLDPVSSIGTQDETTFKNQLSHIIQQMCTITTAFYCVPPAQGADPALPISVKLQGEEVLGLSGSFRHFMLNAAKELQNETIKLMVRCPSSDAGRNKDSFIIAPGKLAYGEEDFLYFFGQLIGISIRSDAPLALSLLRATWRSLLLSEKECNDNSDDLIEADILCATYLKKLDSLATKMAFDNFLSMSPWPKFQYPSMDNSQVVQLCPDGSNIAVSFTNRDLFVKLLKQLREKELKSTNKVTKILSGLSTIIPLPAILGLFTSDHLELRIAGSPEVNLSLLKSHTHYQVGVSENDPHIMYFWAALESFTSEELKKFIKFSANLERLPVTCPCQALNTDNQHQHHQNHQQDSSSASHSNTVHVPPFPMKIAPIDIPPSATTEEIDKRLIRVETCLFLIKLPPYSSLQVTRQQLLFAINCREDPLSG